MSAHDGFTPWPDDLADRYRAAGWWRGDTLGGLLRAWADRFGDDVAIVDGGARLSYRDLARAADRLAAHLHALGIAPGDRVLVQLPNGTAFVVLLFALCRLGALPVLAMPAHREHEIGHLAGFSEAVAYAVPAELRGFDHLALARSVQARHPGLAHVLVTGAGAAGPGPDAIDLDALLAADPPSAALPPGPDPGDIALFLLSGGTTGLPKLIPRTHDDYAYNLRASAEVCGLDRDSAYLVALPIGHNFPLACPGMLGTLAAGGRVVLAPSGDPATAFPLIAREGVTHTALVPALAIRWLDDAAGRAAADLSSLRVVQVGGARLAPEHARRVRPELGATLQQVFGMAEGLLNHTRLDDPDEVLVATQGRPLSPGDEIRVVDPLGRPVAAGEPGGLETRGPYTLRGYWRAPHHNARAFTPDGFYRTGDVVRLRPDGNLVVDGREKDLINRGGEKISAEEVEDLILSHPAVASVAAVAMPDRVLGERTAAYAVLRPGADLDLAGLVAHLRGRHVAAFKLPERLEVVPDLPLTSVGKVDKAALRTDVAARLDKETQPS
jgi:2,3-dihydroxybenzoate-AMP ligase